MLEWMFGKVMVFFKWKSKLFIVGNIIINRVNIVRNRIGFWEVGVTIAIWIL